MMKIDIESFADAYDQALPAGPGLAPRGSLLMLAGLPASGKSQLAANVSRLMSAVQVSTDVARRLALDTPTYADEETLDVYHICHRVIERRLQRNQRIVFDASNHRHRYLHNLFKVIDRLAAPAAICVVTVDADEARRRLQRRRPGVSGPGGISDATWRVYQWMVANTEPIPRPHLKLDSTGADQENLARQAADFWLSVENGLATRATSA